MDLYVNDFPDIPMNNQYVGWMFIVLGLFLGFVTCMSLHRHMHVAQMAIEKDEDIACENRSLPRYNPYVTPMSTTHNPNIKIRMNAPFCAAAEMIS